MFGVYRSYRLEFCLFKHTIYERFDSMTYFRLMSSLLLFGLLAPSVSAEVIENKAKFMNLIVDKKLVQGETWVTIHKDGTVEGKGPKGGSISGTWEWKDRYYCRRIVIVGEVMPHDCQLVSIADDTVTFTHKDGAGVSVRWTIK